MSVIGLPIGATADGATLLGEGPPSVASPIDLLAANPNLIPIYLFIGSPYDPGTGAEVPVYKATAPFTSDASDTPPSQVFEVNRITVPLDIENNLTIERGKLRATGTTTGDILLSTELEGDRIDELATHLWDGRSVRVLIGFDGYKLSECAEIFSGIAEGAAWDRDHIRIRCRSPRIQLERAIQTNLYGGVGNGLAMTFTMAAAGDAYLYRDLTGVTNYTIQSGDVLEYSVHWPSGSVAKTSFDFTCTDASTLRASGAVDQNGVSADPATDLSSYTAGNWYRRQIPIPAALVGKAIANYDLACEYDAGGTVVASIGDVKITDGAGTTRKPIVSPTQTTIPTVADHRNSASNTLAMILTPEGGTELAGKPKPLAYGPRRQKQLILVDSTNLVYQGHDGSAQGFNAVRDRAVELTLDADYATYAALLAASVASSEYATCKARGLARLGASPDGIVTGDIDGDNSGALGYVSTTAGVIRKIAGDKAGIADPGGFDVGALRDLDIAQPAANGIDTGLEPVTIADAVDRVANSIGAFVDFTRAGRLTVTRLVDPTTATPKATLTSVEPNTFTGKVADIPANTVRIGYRHYGQPLSGQETDKIALTDAERFDYSQEFRYVSDAAPAVLVPHPSSAVYVIQTELDDADDARAEAARQLALYSPTRHVYDVDAWNTLYGYQLGDVITLQVPRYDLSAGKNFVIIGIRESPVDGGNHVNSTHLVLWGRQN